MLPTGDCKKKEKKKQLAGFLAYNGAVFLDKVNNFP